MQCFHCNAWISCDAEGGRCKVCYTVWIEKLKGDDRAYVRNLREWREELIIQRDDEMVAGVDAQIANVIESWQLFSAYEVDTTPMFADGFDSDAFRTWSMEVAAVAKRVRESRQNDAEGASQHE